MTGQRDREGVPVDTFRMDVPEGVQDLRDLVPQDLRDRWRSYDKRVRTAGWEATFAAPLACARAERAAPPDEETVAKYMRELGELPPLRRLRPNQRWLETIDDPFLPGGLYERQVLSIYRRFGRYWGDVYWLAFRNSNYGLAYYFKPEQFKGLTSYALLPRSVVRKSWGWKYKVAGYELLQVRLPLGFELLLGWQVRGAVLDPFGPRSPVNMEFRPMFSLRRAG